MRELIYRSAMDYQAPKPPLDAKRVELVFLESSLQVSSTRVRRRGSCLELVDHDLWIVVERQSTAWVSAFWASLCRCRLVCVAPYLCLPYSHPIPFEVSYKIGQLRMAEKTAGDLEARR